MEHYHEPPEGLCEVREAELCKDCGECLASDIHAIGCSASEGATNIKVAKALAIAGQIIPSTTITVEGDVPELGELSSYRSYYNEQGSLVAAALIRALPGGTVDALLVALLDHKRSLLRVTNY
jgi:coenzyme F420-reducing hydrogenase beta subunit